MKRQGSIYGSSPPYIPLGVLPNADNLDISHTRTNRDLRYGSDVQDYGQPVARCASAAPLNPSFIERLFTLVKDNSTSVGNFLVVVVILVAETLVNGQLFTCPCQQPQNILHGVAFLAAPATALFVVGLLASNKMWVMVTGYKNRDRSLSAGHTSIAFTVAGVIARASIAPLAWLVYGFIDGNFYQCAKSSDPCHDTAERKAEMTSESQVIGYLLMVATMIVALAGMVVVRYCGRLSYAQDNYIRIYRQMERIEMQRQFEEHAQTVARQNVHAFLEKETRPKAEWDYISTVPGLTPTKEHPNGYGPSLSPLNHLVQQEQARPDVHCYGEPVADVHDNNRPGVQTQTSLEYVRLQELDVNNSRQT